MASRSFSKNSSVRLEPFQHRYHEQALEIQARMFSKYVPIDQAFNIDEKSHLRIERSCKDAQYIPELSVCATDANTNRVLAAIKNKPFVTNKKRYVQFDNAEALMDHERTFLDVLHHLDSRWEFHFNRIGYSANEHEFLHYVIGFTDECAMGNGLFTELWEYNEELARKNGFKYIYSLLASKEMQGLMVKKFGFEPIEEIPMSEFTVDGVKVCKAYVDQDSRRRDLKLQLAIKKL